MKVTHNAIEITTGNGATISELVTHLQMYEDQKITHAGQPLVIFIDPNHSTGFVTGLILSYKDRKTFLESQETGGHKIKKRKSTPGYQGVEVSLFSVKLHKSSLLFTYYRGAMSIYSFAHLLEKEYRKILISKAAVELYGKDAVGKKVMTKEIEGLIKKKGLKYLTTKIIYKKGDIDTVLKDFETIQSVGIGATEIVIKDDPFIPLRPLSSGSEIMFNVPASTKIGLIRKAIKTVYDFNRNRKIRIIGKAAQGAALSEVINSDENLMNFGHDTFDKLVDKLPSDDWNNFKKCDAMNELVAGHAASSLI
jgi:hypothetical protein